MEWNGIKWNEMEWDGMKWNEIEWNGMRWNEMEGKGMKWSETEWNEMKWDGMKWNEMNECTSARMWLSYLDWKHLNQWQLPLTISPTSTSTGGSQCRLLCTGAAHGGPTAVTVHYCRPANSQLKCKKAQKNRASLQVIRCPTGWRTQDDLLSWKLWNRLWSTTLKWEWEDPSWVLVGSSNCPPCSHELSLTCHTICGQKQQTLPIGDCAFSDFENKPDMKLVASGLFEHQYHNSIIEWKERDPMTIFQATVISTILMISPCCFCTGCVRKENAM